jgi:predicted enzyme related to lactoylglutathione lyase
MADRSGYAPGTPSWVDLGAADFERARQFYGDLFGWEFELGDENMGYYSMATSDGRRVAGIAPRQSEDQPAVWTVYIASDDADETAQRIREHGGTMIMEPLDVMDQGRMLIAADPGGAVFGVWEAGAHTGAQKVNAPGSFSWCELNARDGKAADQFYSAVFGHQPEQIGDGVKFDYTVWHIGGQQVCGRLQMTAEWEGVPPHWMPYFAVDGDCDKAAERVTELGGRVQVEPFDSPYGRMAVVADPDGANFTIIHLADSPPS